MAVLLRYISAGNRPADGSLLGGGRSAVISDELEQNRFLALLVVQNELRTVRSLGADSPPPTENSGTETLRFLCVLIF